MKIEANENGIALIREAGDKAISHESTVTHHMRRLLNERDGGGWTRFYPDREGLTSCRQGVQNRKTGQYYWHERYAIEDAAQEFNKSKRVWYMGGMDHAPRLEYLRKELRAERISWGELAELQSLAAFIDPEDVELLEAAGVSEFPESE